jgi:hypothetical protein
MSTEETRVTHIAHEDENVKALSEEVMTFHLRSFPQAERADYFPRPVKIGAWIGLAAGIVIALILSFLLRGGSLTIGGLEGLFSMTAFTFHAFWAFMGASAGLAIGGIIGILTAKRNLSGE